MEFFDRLILIPLIFGYGAITASFLCVAAERIPKGLTLGGRSYCQCGRQLKLSENIPVLGWLATWGTARCCGSKIPVFYLLAEASLAVVWTAGWLVSLPVFAATVVVSSIVLYHVGKRRLESVENKAAGRRG